MKSVWQTLLSLIIVSILLSLFGFLSAIYPIRIKSSTTPKQFGVNFDAITLTTKDQLHLSGWFIPNKNPKAKAIILMHGYPADKGNILPLTIFLHQKYHLLYFDFRRLGESEGTISTIGKREQLDLIAAVDFLKSKGIHDIGLWGFSMGGAVALMSAANIPEIKVIVADSSYARLDWVANDYYHIPLIKYALGYLTRLWGLLFLQYDIKQISPMDAVRQLKIPVLLIHSSNDQVISYNHALALKEALSKNDKAVLITTDHHQHGEIVKNYDKLILSFFENHL